MNACVKKQTMIAEQVCRECNLACRHAGEPTTKERLDAATYGTAEYWNGEKDENL